MVDHQLLQTIFAAGCVSTLYNIFNIEQKLVATLSIDEVAEYFEMKSSMHMPELAVFQWGRRVNKKGCVSFRRRPRLCHDMACQMHLACVVCDSREHGAIEMYGGTVATRCPVIQRMDNELQMLRNCWSVSGTEMYHFFFNISEQSAFSQS